MESVQYANAEARCRAPCRSDSELPWRRANYNKHGDQGGRWTRLSEGPEGPGWGESRTHRGRPEPSGAGAEPDRRDLAHPALGLVSDECAECSACHAGRSL